MPPTCILDEDDALELLALLVTSARTQVDEAAEYGPMRLLAAAHRLGDLIGARASAETASAVSTALARMPPLAVPRYDAVTAVTTVATTSPASTTCAGPSPHTSSCTSVPPRIRHDHRPRRRH